MFSVENVDSKYYDLEDLNVAAVQEFRCGYRVLHLNIQGIQSKFDDFKELLSKFNYMKIEIDFVVLCEAFLK